MLDICESRQTRSSSRPTATRWPRRRQPPRLFPGFVPGRTTQGREASSSNTIRARSRPTICSSTSRSALVCRGVKNAARGKRSRKELVAAILDTVQRRQPTREPNDGRASGPYESWCRSRSPQPRSCPSCSTRNAAAYPTGATRSTRAIASSAVASQRSARPAKESPGPPQSGGSSSHPGDAR